MKRRCTVVFTSLSTGVSRTYYGEGSSDEKAEENAKRQCYANNIDDAVDCGRYVVLDCNNIPPPPPPPNPFDVVKSISAKEVDLDFNQLRNGFLRYSVKGSAWQDVMWDSGQMKIKDIAFRDDIPSLGGIFVPDIMIPLVVIGGDERLLFQYLDLGGDLNKQLKESRSSSWIYFGWPDPNNSISEAMKAQSIRSLSWNGSNLRVTVIGGDGKTCTTEINTVFVPFPGPGGFQTFPTGWSCS